MHEHQWQSRACLPLGLPTREGFVERVMVWLCPACGCYVTITGEIRVGTPLFTPEFWDQQERQQRKRLQGRT